MAEPWNEKQRNPKQMKEQQWNAALKSNHNFRTRPLKSAQRAAREDRSFQANT
jgi:hypothetical protein